MIYQYPEEFIVPVVYVRDLKDKTFYRNQESKSSHAGKLIIPDEELNENETLLGEIDIYGAFQNKDINFLNMVKEVLQEPIIKGDIDHGGLEDESIKNILSDIDEDYANSETLNMKV